MWSPASSAILVKWRAQLLACQTVIDAGYVTGSFHYPNVDMTREDLPNCLLGERNHKRSRYAEGAVGLIGFDLLAKFHVNLASVATSADVETFARDVILDLWSQYDGLAWRDIDTGFASDPTPALRADGVETGIVFRSILITANVGLDRS